VVVMPADVDALVTVVVVAVAAAAADDDGATEKLKPLVEAAGNNDPDVAEAEVADGAVDAPVAETEAIVGVEADEDEPKEKPDVVADELPAAVVLENSEGAGEACEVAKERLVAGEDTEVVGVADVLLAKAKAGAVEAEENKEAAVFPVAELAVDGVKPKDGADTVAGEAEKPKDGVVVAAGAGEEAVVVLKSGAEVVDPNSDEPVAPPNPKAGDDAAVEAVLDAAAPELNEKPNDGAEAAAVVVVEPDADEPKLKPVEAPEKRLGVDAAEEAAPNRLGVVAAAEVAPNKFGVVAAAEVAPNRPGVVAAEVVAPNRPGVVVTEPAADAPKRPGLLAGAEAAPKRPGLLAAEVAAPNKLGVVPAGDAAAVCPKRDGAGAADEAAAVDCPNENPVDPKPKGEEAAVEAGAAADEAPNREEPKVGAEEAAAEDEEKSEEPKAGAGEEAAGGWEKEKADGVEEKEKGEEAVEPAAAELPKPKEVAMAGGGGDLGESILFECSLLHGIKRSAHGSSPLSRTDKPSRTC
jgi:hypothetical protein